MVSRSTDVPVPLGEFVPEADRRIVLHGLGWAGYVPGVDLAMLCRLAAVTPVSAAVAELREILRAAT